MFWSSWLVHTFLRKGVQTKEKMNERLKIESGEHSSKYWICLKFIFYSPFIPQVKGEGKRLSLSWYKEQTRVMTSLIFKTSNIYALSQKSCYVELNIQSLHFRPKILLSRQDTEQLHLRPNNCCLTLLEQ